MLSRSFSRFPAAGDSGRRRGGPRPSRQALGASLGLLAILLALLLALVASPAEARTAPEPGAGTAAARAAASCPYLHFCVFSGKNFQGTMHPMKSCTWHRTHFLPASWVNNQTAGTRARFYDNRLNLLHTTPGAYSLDADSWTLGLYTFYFRPC
jgi:hypothetical protein